MARERQHLTARLIELRNAIRRKYKAFKDGTEESEILLEKQYKPIITALRKPTAEMVEPKTEIKHEPYSSDNEEPMELEDDDDEHETSHYIQETYNAPMTQKYILDFFREGPDRNTDNIYGPRVNNEVLMVGDSKLDFDDDGNIYVKGTNFGNTEGLYELLFKRLPRKELYNEQDLNAYKRLLVNSNGHKKNYTFNGNINRPVNSVKYKAIIAKLFPKTTSGKGMTWKSTESRDIIHWDDPNELIERLRHIAMSTETGNRVHSNEIISIMEELREAGYIKGKGNSRFASLLK